MAHRNTDVLIIGAGPAGAIAAALLDNAGFETILVEQTRFPRFVIGESLLPRCMDLLEEADLLAPVREQHFMRKDGAVILRGDKTSTIRFSQQFTPGWDHTYQVPRAEFDLVLADAVASRGVPILWEHRVTDVGFGADGESVTRITDGQGGSSTVGARFILDGSGYGRVLPRLLDLDRPSNLPLRESLFTHVTGDRRPQGDAEGRIWICLLDDPENPWVWIIPFADGRTSVGVVARPQFLERFPEDPDIRLRAILDSDPNTRNRLAQTKFSFPVQRIRGYSIGVSRLHGPGYALMGNATEFLDPVFSSGVTLAMESANRAAKTLIRQLRGEHPDWEREYVDYMKRGIDTFRTLVEAWYDGRLPTIFFSPRKPQTILNQICSVMAGYVWDLDNPCVRQHERAVDTIARACAALADASASASAGPRGQE